MKACLPILAQGLAAQQVGALDPGARSPRLSGIDQKDGSPAPIRSLENLLNEAKVAGPLVAQIVKELRPSNDIPLTRGAVCRAFFIALPQ